jgi:hypothetical protein
MHWATTFIEALIVVAFALTGFSNGDIESSPTQPEAAAPLVSTAPVSELPSAPMIAMPVALGGADSGVDLNTADDRRPATTPAETCPTDSVRSRFGTTRRLICLTTARFSSPGGMAMNRSRHR